MSENYRQLREVRNEVQSRGWSLWPSPDHLRSLKTKQAQYERDRAALQFKWDELEAEYQKAGFRDLQVTGFRVGTNSEYQQDWDRGKGLTDVVQAYRKSQEEDLRGGLGLEATGDEMAIITAPADLVGAIRLGSALIRTGYHVVKQGAGYTLRKHALKKAAQVGAQKASSVRKRLTPEAPRRSSQIPGSILSIKLQHPAGKGRGLIGMVKPGGTVDEALRKHYLEIARSPEMAEALKRYDQIAKLLRQKPSASIEDLIKTLDDDVTFSRIGHIDSGLFAAGQHSGPKTYWIQGNPTTLYGIRAGRHELTHLAAALNGQTDTLFHEIAVTAATTPENLIIGAGVFVAIVGTAYWISL